MRPTQPDREALGAPRSWRHVRLAAGLLALGFVVNAGAQTPIPESRSVWFGELLALPPWPEAVDAALMNHTMALLQDRPADIGHLPDVLETDRSPRLVALSISDTSSPARVSIGRGMGVPAAVADAVAAQRQACPTPCPALWVKLDLIDEMVSATTVRAQDAHRWERSLYGLGLSRESGVLILPEELVARTIIDSDGRINPRALAAYAGDSTLDARLRQSPVEAFVFTTRTLFSDGHGVQRLFRGHRTFEAVSADQALQAARRGGAYLIRSVDDNGRFAYHYRTKRNVVLDRYNMLRHAGTVFSMLELYVVTQDPDLLDAATRALHWMTRAIHPDPNDKEAAVVVADGHTKLGGNGLAAIAIAKYIEITGDRSLQPLLQGLGRRMQALLAEDGRFKRQKATYPEDVDTGFVSAYYPGEAILGLTQIHAIEGSAHWLDSAERAAHYLIAVRDRGKPDAALPHDHWLLYGLDALYRQRPKPLYLEHAARLTRAICRAQRRSGPPPDWVGSYYRPPRSTPTATRSEGLAAACRLFLDHQRPAEAAAAWQAVQLGVRFQLQTQFGPESVMHLPNPRRALGGFHKSLTDFDIQIDYVQHNISALLAYAELSQDQRLTETTTRQAAFDYPQWIAQYRAARSWSEREASRKLTRATLLHSLALGKQFLLRNQTPAGNFNYTYDFVAQTLDPNDNGVRQAGTTWGLALMLSHAPDAETQQALNRALQFFFKHTVPGPGAGLTLIAYPGAPECKTGTVALVGLAIIEYLRSVQENRVDVDPEWELELRTRLAGCLAFLKHCRLPNGRFSRSCSLPDAVPSPRSSSYADGEALLCLVKAAKYLGYVELVPMIEASASEMTRHYTADAWRTDPDSAATKGFFQWSCMALWEYQDAGWVHAAAYRDYVVSLAWWMVYTHETLRRSRNTAYAYEGIIPAYRIAVQEGDRPAVQDLGYVIDRGLFKLTSWQVGGPLQDHNHFLMSHPTADPLAVGGVMNHRSAAALRIDVAQHQMHAVLLALQYVYTE